jgi:NAD(P)H dehydrogenase (quinone)
MGCLPRAVFIFILSPSPVPADAAPLRATESRRETRMKILVVVVHPRPSSLTHAVARTFAEALEARGHAAVWADLHAEGFDPVLREADEPDWNHPAKAYSPEVRAEMARIEAAEATVVVFPVWWWSMPAMLKGWIERVWNNGWAYGGKS